MIKKVGIINYGAGNLMSITKAIEVLGLQTYILDKPIKKEFDLLILPGVGSFGPAMKTIFKNGLYEEIINFFNSEKPILGVCLGIQLIFEKSEEAKDVCGLKLLKGKVVKFKNKSLPIPHMCWNIVKFKENIPLILDGLKDKEFFYFVHSYYPVPRQKDIIFATTEYGEEFCSMIVKDNIVATQFHLEKSGPKGLKLLENIIKYFNKL
jgi:imidazole glycerol phosphate synthase glutamine amidotransferase subunit